MLAGEYRRSAAEAAEGASKLVGLFSPVDLGKTRLLMMLFSRRAWEEQRAKTGWDPQRQFSSNFYQTLEKWEIRGSKWHRPGSMS